LPPDLAPEPVQYIRVGKAYDPATNEGYRAALRNEDNAINGPDDLAVYVDPQYRYDDQRNDPLIALRNMSPANRAAFQEQMVRAGLLTEGRFFQGQIDEPTQAAMLTVMGQANVNGTNWRGAAMELARLGDINTEQARAEALSNRRFITPAYQEPDQASINQLVKQTLAQRLGREPHDWELALLGQGLQANFYQRYQSEVAASRAEFEAGNRAIVNEEMYEAAGTVPALVDPEARLNESIDTMFGKELDNQEAAAVNRQSFRGLQTGLLSLENYAGA
jgi:hypothetical protein